MDKIGFLTSNHKEFIKFLKTRFPLYHNSNIFFRDVHYGVIMFFKEKNMRVKYAEAEIIATRFLGTMEKNGILKKLTQQSWVLIYPEFSKKAS